jgi:hypothetical protein
MLISLVWLREACERALKEKHFLDDSETEGFLDDPIVSIVSHLQQLELLGQVFQKAAEDDTPSEVSLDLFNLHLFFPFSLKITDRWFIMLWD